MLQPSIPNPTNESKKKKAFWDTLHGSVDKSTAGILLNLRLFDLRKLAFSTVEDTQSCMHTLKHFTSMYRNTPHLVVLVSSCLALLEQRLESLQKAHAHKPTHPSPHPHTCQGRLAVMLFLDACALLVHRDHCGGENTVETCLTLKCATALEERKWMRFALDASELPLYHDH